MAPIDLSDIRGRIIDLREQMPAEHALLAGISGIDASGKGHITQQLAELLIPSLNVAVICVDGWLNLPHLRFSDNDPGRHFYHHSLRIDEMFDRLVLPLKRDRRIDLAYDHTDETASEYRRERVLFDDIDVILLEGIFLFQPRFLSYFDLTVWTDCSFETALQRAIDRSQEGLGREGTITAYETIYFPAQHIHSQDDQPLTRADFIIKNEQL
jgi:uridine kinase